MNIMQKNALRQLQYDPSIKISICFEEARWTTELGIRWAMSHSRFSLLWDLSRTTDERPMRIASALLPCQEQNVVLRGFVLRNLAEAHGSSMSYEFVQGLKVSSHQASVRLVHLQIIFPVNPTTQTSDVTNPWMHEDKFL